MQLLQIYQIKKSDLLSNFSANLDKAQEFLFNETRFFFVIYITFKIEFRPKN